MKETIMKNKVRELVSNTYDTIRMMNGHIPGFALIDWVKGDLKKLIKEEKMENVVLKKNYRGLSEGTEFAYDVELGAWVFEESEEEIADSSVRSKHVKVQFSDSFVKNNPELFEVPGQDEIERQKKEAQIKQVESQIANLQEELNKLKS